MNLRQQRLYEMLERVNAFHATHAKRYFPAGSAGDRMFEAVGGAIDDAARCSVDRARGRGAAAVKAGARKTLWRSLDAIHRTARGISTDRPGFDQRFRLPRGNGNHTLLNASRAFASAAR